MIKKCAVTFAVAAMTAMVFCRPAASQKLLRVTLMFSSGNQRSVFVDKIRQFEQENPGIDVKNSEEEQERYKERIPQWLQDTEPHADVYFWFAGAKLKSFVEKGWVMPIEDLWHSQGWDTSFTKASRLAVSFDGKAYGLPLSYYQWGIYYFKSFFMKNGIAPPKTWDQLLRVGEQLKSIGVVPFTLGSKYRWTAAGWFDYLDLRINGLQFHLDLMAGKIPYTDERVKAVFTKWRVLIESDFFLPNHHDLDWREALPYLYRKHAGMLLMGNFLIPQVPSHQLGDLDFIRFPQIDENLPYYEEAPLDILVIPHNTRRADLARKFLAFMARPENQYELNSKMGMISPNKKVPLGEDRFIRAGAEILEQADGISQFYDRDTPPEMADAGMDAMIRFMKDPQQMDQILADLETKRQRIFK